MCGIAGIVRTGSARLPPPRALQRMLRAIEYRGPDDSGAYVDDEIQLGAVRLAIIDLKGGRQPAHGCTDRIVSVYNGELFNHHELRSELIKAQHRMTSECDTEVIPHLYEESGASLVDRLRGMYAFAVWNADSRELLLARDRVGVKPLYYAQTRDYLVFASEIKALFASGLVTPEIDRSAVDDVFSLSYPCPPKTMFKGVFELRPAHVIKTRSRTPVSPAVRYWRAPFKALAEHDARSRKDVAEELRELLRRRIYDHLQADVRVASYLSGGIDSSLITAIAKDVTGDAPNTFSIGFDTTEHDESDFAALVAEHLGCPRESVICGEDTADHFMKMIWHTELPLQFPLALPLMQLSALAKSRGFPVVLTGEGADESLGGYDCFRAQKMRRSFDRFGLRGLKPLAYSQLYKWHGMPTGTVDQLLSIQQRPAPEITEAFSGVYPAWYENWQLLNLHRDELLSPDGRMPRPTTEAPAGFESLVSPAVGGLHPLDAELALELETRLPSWILLIGDRSSMANGVEARVPFLDHEVVEFITQLPPSYKMRGFTEKAILRDAATGLVPEKIRTRQKRPFYTPLSEWFFSPRAPEFVEDALCDQALRISGLFRAETVKTLRENLRTAPANSIARLQTEWILTLVLGSQLLHQMFVLGQSPHGVVNAITDEAFSVRT